MIEVFRRLFWETDGRLLGKTLGMSNDGAAILASTLSALLVLGFIELQKLSKEIQQRLSYSKDYYEIETESVASMLRGAGPTPQQIEALQRLHLSSGNSGNGRWVIFILWWIWLTLSFSMAYSLCWVLFWAVQRKHEADGWIAESALISTVAGVLTLLMGAFGRAAFRYLSIDKNQQIDRNAQLEIRSRLQSHLRGTESTRRVRPIRAAALPWVYVPVTIAVLWFTTPTLTESPVKCHGNSCQGKDPQTFACTMDASNVMTRGEKKRSLEVRYSKRCHAVWARIIGGNAGDRIIISGSSGKQSGTIDFGTDAYTRMISAGGRSIRACTTVTQPKKMLCTDPIISLPSE